MKCIIFFCLFDYLFKRQKISSIDSICLCVYGVCRRFMMIKVFSSLHFLFLITLPYIVLITYCAREWGNYLYTNNVSTWKVHLSAETDHTLRIGKKNVESFTILNVSLRARFQIKKNPMQKSINKQQMRYNFHYSTMNCG